MYLDSLHQRQKADSLLNDLKSFSFASADFAEVRDFALSHAGRGVQEFPPSLPTLGFPILDSQGRAQIPSVWTKPRCTSKRLCFRGLDQAIAADSDAKLSVSNVAAVRYDKCWDSALGSLRKI